MFPSTPLQVTDTPNFFARNLYLQYTEDVDHQYPEQINLLPVRHKQQELFLCDIAGVMLRSDLASLEHPIFSLSKQPDTTERVYVHGDIKLIVTPSIRGMATIYDKDILNFAVSSMIAARNAGKPVSRKIKISARAFLVFANRCTGGSDYEALEDALVRLRGTTLRTNIKTGGKVQTDVFGLVDSASVSRKDGVGRVTGLNIELSEWLFNAVNSMEVLSLSPDYFRLKKATERRVYEIARKHCGDQDSWTIGLEKLHHKSGVRSSLKHFRYFMRQLADANHLPDYATYFLDEADQVCFRKRSRLVCEL